jgi:hypothetical protein
MQSGIGATMPIDGANVRSALATRARRIACLLVLALVAAERAHAAGGAYVVDDSEIAKPGECKVESWASFAGNGDRVFATVPACVFDIIRPVEVGAQLSRTRADGTWTTGLTLKAKTSFQSVETNKIGIGIVAGTSFDLVTQQHTALFVYVPVSIALAEAVRLNLNGGWLWDRIAGEHKLTWGAGFEWTVLKNSVTITLIGEIFGQSANRPGAQAGIRITPHEKVDFDVIYGRNLAGENANWITAGVNLRF